MIATSSLCFYKSGKSRAEGKRRNPRSSAIFVTSLRRSALGIVASCAQIKMYYFIDEIKHVSVPRNRQLGY